MEWKSRDHFIKDPDIEIIGYQSDFRNLIEGYFVFNHQTCNNSLSLKAGKFKDLYNGEIFSENKNGTEECKKICLKQDNLESCPVKCECSYVREIIQILKNQ